MAFKTITMLYLNKVKRESPIIVDGWTLLLLFRDYGFMAMTPIRL